MPGALIAVVGHIGRKQGLMAAGEMLSQAAGSVGSVGKGPLSLAQQADLFQQRSLASPGVQVQPSPSQAPGTGSRGSGFSPSTIRKFVAASLTGSPNVSKRGHRVFRKYAGSVCRSAREELGAAGLLWTKAAWENSLAAAMTGLEWLSRSLEVGLLDGFDTVVASNKRAHIEGLKRPARTPGRAARGASHMQERGATRDVGEQRTAGASGNGEERRPISCSVKTLGGKSVQLQMPPAAKVGALKDAIAARTTIPSSEQKLVVGGKQLRNACRLEQLCSGEVLDVALNLGLAGGGDGEREAEGRSQQVPGHGLLEHAVPHGLVNPGQFSDFQRNLRAELAALQEQAATNNGSHASSNGDLQPMDSSGGDGSEGTESEGAGDDLSDGEEFRTPEQESSDEATSEDLRMIDDACVDTGNPLVTHSRFNGAGQSDSNSEDFSQLLKGGFKPRAPKRAAKPSPLHRKGRRAHVQRSFPDSSADESGMSEDQSPAADGNMGCRRGVSPESSASSCGSKVLPRGRRLLASPSESVGELSGEKEGTGRRRPRRIDDDSEEDCRTGRRRKVVLSQSSLGSDSIGDPASRLSEVGTGAWAFGDGGGSVDLSTAPNAPPQMTHVDTLLGVGMRKSGEETPEAPGQPEPTAIESRGSPAHAMHALDVPVGRIGLPTAVSGPDSHGPPPPALPSAANQLAPPAVQPMTGGPDLLTNEPQPSRSFDADQRPSSEQPNAEDGLEENATPEPRRGRASAVELDSSSSTPCDAAPFTTSESSGGVQRAESDERAAPSEQLAVDFGTTLRPAHALQAGATPGGSVPVGSEEGGLSAPDYSENSNYSGQPEPTATGRRGRPAHAIQGSHVPDTGTRERCEEGAQGAGRETSVASSAPTASVIAAAPVAPAFPTGAPPAASLPDGATVVHSEQDGKLLTVRTRLLGTFFFAKRKFADRIDYKDPKDGPQGFCRRYGEVLGHQVEIRRLRPSREFGSYPDWPTAHPNLRGQLHLEEAIKAGCPCKPYLDLERDGGLAEGETLQTVIAVSQAAIIDIFRGDYSLELTADAFCWIPVTTAPAGSSAFTW